MVHTCCHWVISTGDLESRTTVPLYFWPSPTSISPSPALLLLLHCNLLFISDTKPKKTLIQTLYPWNSIPMHHFTIHLSLQLCFHPHLHHSNFAPGFASTHALYFQAVHLQENHLLSLAPKRKRSGKLGCQKRAVKARGSFSPQLQLHLLLIRLCQLIWSFFRRLLSF